MKKLNEKSNAKWCNEIASNTELWALNEADSLPFFIKEEYFRLKGLFEQNQSYGAYLEIKDLLELVLKTPILFLISKLLYENRKSNLKLDDKVYDILKFLLNKGDLSLGDWWHVAKQLSKLELENKKYPELFILKNINDIYSQTFFEYANIVNWRNKAIGHGALMFDADERFRRSIRYLLIAIKEHIFKVSDLYEKIHLAFYDEANRKLEKSNINSYLKDISLWIKNDELSYKLTPFMDVEDGKIYCFDSYLEKDKFELFDYLESTRIRKSISELKDLIEKLNLRSISKDSIKKISNAYLEKEEELYLSRGIRNVVEQPTYLRDLISETIATNTKGVFLLQMERGMGKTTFVKMLDAHFAMLKKTHIKINGYSVRAYYFNNSYSSNVDIFRYVFEDNMHIDDNGENLKFAGFPFTSNTDFANTINSYQQKYSELKNTYDVNDKLVIVLDGIDNIECSSGSKNVLDLIPVPTLLNDKCFLILTARSDEELSDEVRNKLSKLEFTKKILITHKNVLNVKFVDHVMDQILGSSKNEIKQVLSPVMSNCIQTINLLKPISFIAQDYVFLNVEDIFEQYFRFLQFIYSDKYFVIIERLLILLANSDISLTIIEIKRLLQIETESFLFLGILEDIKPFLDENFNTTNREFTISITNKELKKYINEHFDAESEKLQLHYLKIIDEILDKQKKIAFDDWFILYYVIKNTHDVLPDLYLDYICDGDLLLKVTNLILNNYEILDGKVTDTDFLILEIANKILVMVSFDTKKNLITPFELHLIPTATEIKIKIEYVLAVLLLKFDLKALALETVKTLYKELKNNRLLQSQKLTVKKINDFIELHFDVKELNKKCSLKKYESNVFFSTKKGIIDTYTYRAFGLDIPISHHNILEGPREFVLGVLDGTLNYLNQVNQNTLNLDMLKRIF